jgi:hypothetical protein
MDIGKYKQAMRPKKYLDGKFVIYDETMPDASDAQLGARDEFAIGGGVIQGEDLGTREGFYEPKLVNDPKGKYSVKFPYKQDYGNPRFRGVQYGTKEEIEQLIKDRTIAADASYKKGVGKAAQIAKEKAEADIKKTIDSFIEQGDYENFKTKPYESQLQRKLPSGELRQSAGGRVNPKTFQYIRDMLDAGDFENLSRITGRSKEELINFNEKLPERGAVDIKLRAQRAGESNPRILTDEERRERGRAAYTTRKESESKAKKYASKQDLEDFSKIKKQRIRLNNYFAENPNAINDTEFGKEIKKLMDIRLDKEGNLVYNTRPDSYYVEKAKNKDIFDVFDVTPIKSKKQSTRFPVNLNITPKQFNGAFIEGQVDKYFRKGGRFEGNQEILNKVSNFLDQQGVRVELTDVGRIGAAPGVGVNRATGQFPTIYNTLKKMKIPDELLSDVNPVSKAVQLKESIPGLKFANEIDRPESAMTREMFDRFNKLRGVLIPGLEEIKDSLKKLPDDIKSKRYFTAALKGLGIVATPLIVSGMYNDFKSGKTVMETLERNLIGTDAIGGMKDIFALSPEEREARSVVKQAEMDEQIAQDFSGLDTDFQTPRVESKMSLEEALKEYEEGLKRVELEREQEEAGRAEGRASSFEGLKDLMLGERFQPQEIPQQFLASGGRVGFADGTPPDPSKRKFMKIMGALAAVPVIGKYFNLAKPLTKAAPAAVEAVRGIPPYFFKMVEKIKQFGDDVTKRFSTQEREQVYNYRTSDADYELYEDLNTGDVRLKVIKGDPDLPGYKEQELTLSKGKIDEATGNVPDAYDEYTVRSDFDGKMKDIDEGIEGIDDLIEDTIGFENVSIKELEDMGYDVNRLSPDFKKKLGIK